MQTTCSNKPIVQQLIQSFIKYNVRHVVISPGSRNAPLTISFTDNLFFTCYSIPDERSAAFYALGMAKQLKEPVAIVCTSGSAALNYAPAIAEAYYQELPLIVITADRPPEWIDQEDGQTIRQADIYRNYIGYSVSLPKGNISKEIEISKKEIEKALSIATANKQSPVHINIPFDEPLYETVEFDFTSTTIKATDSFNGNDNYSELLEAWNNSEKVMIIAGVLNPNSELNEIIDILINQKNALVIAPSYSNLKNDKIISIPEIIFNTISDETKKLLKPDLLISIGSSIVSKATKLFLREFKPSKHFDIDFNEARIDTYLSLSNKIISSHSKALNYVNINGAEKSSSYLNEFLVIQKEKSYEMESFTKKTEFCDLNIFSTLFNNLTSNIDIHFANSTPIRYSELFQSKSNINYFSNRGTSGIDGNTSIAAGSALISNKTTLLITGDISFAYDSNAFWNNHVPNNLKIIIINNGGGNIFRIINGPSKSKSLPYFETNIKKDNRKFCESHGISYLSANNLDDFTIGIESLLEYENCTVLEIFTPNEISAETYKSLFRSLRQ